MVAGKRKKVAIPGGSRHLFEGVDRGCSIVARDSPGRGETHSPGLRLTFPHPSPADVIRQSRCRAAGFRLPGLVAAGRGGDGAARGGRGGAGGGDRGGAARGGVTAAAHGSAALVLLELAHPVTQRDPLVLLLAAARIAGVAAGRGGSAAARSGGGSAAAGSGGRGTRRGSGTGRGRRSSAARGRGGTGRGGSAAARGGSATAAIVLLREQAGVGAVQAGETHQRGGDPSELHFQISSSSKAGGNVR